MLLAKQLCVFCVLYLFILLCVVYLTPERMRMFAKCVVLSPLRVCVCVYQSNVL